MAVIGQYQDPGQYALDTEESKSYDQLMSGGAGGYQEEGREEEQQRMVDSRTGVLHSEVGWTIEESKDNDPSGWGRCIRD